MSLLGIDVGTTGCKSIVFNEEGKILSQAYKEYPEIYPRPGWVEMDPEQIWTAIKEVIKKSVAKVPQDKVQAMCFSVLGVAITPIDKQGKPLYNSLPAVDGRTWKQVEWLKENIGNEEVYRATGIPITNDRSLPKVMWIKENEPEIYKNTWKFVLYEDLILHRLGIGPILSYSTAGLTMAFDPVNKRWAPEVLEPTGIDANILPTARPAGEAVGEISDDIADELGLPRKTVVVTGGHDQALSALGGGLIKDEMSTDCFGTIEAVVSAFKDYNPDPKLLASNHPLSCHVIDGFYISLAFCYTAGALLKWYRDTIALDEKRRARESGKDVYDIIVGESSDEPSRVLVLPHFIGSGTPYLDPKSKGAFVGMTLSTQRGEIVRGILESISYDIRLNIENLESAGIKMDRLNCFGGGARSDKLLQIKADITDKECVALSISETGCLGAAILAGCNVGIYESPQKAVEALIKPRKIFYPNEKNKDTYLEIFTIYKNLYSDLKNVNDQLSDL
jgi:xylulokinase